MLMVKFDDADDDRDLGDRNRATVSVIVFYQRDFTRPQAPDEGVPAQGSERVATQVSFLGTGIGGGDVRMRLQQREDGDLLEKNHWILVGGPNGGYPIEGQSQTQGVFAWYRVVAVAEEDPDDPSNLYRLVTLVGPDWNRDSQTGNPNNCQAVLMDGVVGVYSETIEFSRDLTRAVKAR
jgi:hypothetical protein